MNIAVVRVAVPFCTLLLVSQAVTADEALEASQDSGQVMRAVIDPADGRVTLAEDNQPVLRYNYKTVLAA